MNKLQKPTNDSLTTLSEWTTSVLRGDILRMLQELLAEETITPAEYGLQAARIDKLSGVALIDEWRECFLPW